MVCSCRLRMIAHGAVRQSSLPSRAAEDKVNARKMIRSMIALGVGSALAGTMFAVGCGKGDPATPRPTVAGEATPPATPPAPGPASKGGAATAPRASEEPTPHAKPAPADPSSPPAAGLPRLSDTMPSAVAASRPEANSGADPAADFASFRDVVANKDTAPGKTVLVRGYISSAAPVGAPVVVSECESTGSMVLFRATYKEAQRDLVRGTPSRNTGYGTKCPRIHLRVTAFSPSGAPLGEIVDIYDVRPDPAPTNLPAGVDFVSMDDALMRGPAAVGRTVDTYVYQGHAEKKDGSDFVLLYTQGCAPHGGYNAHFIVPVPPEQRAQILAIPRGDLDPRGCQRVRVRLTAPPVETRHGFEAVVIGIGDTVSDMPRSNP